MPPAYQVDDLNAGQYEHDRWYYAKKRIRLYPGIRNFRSGPWLQDYYADWKSRQGPLRWCLNAATWSAFQLWLPYRARQIAHKYGLGAEWSRRALKLARECFLDPNDIALFRIESADEARNFLRRFEHAGINRAINPRNWQADCALGNKLKFHNICADHGLPHPAIHAVAAEGTVTVYSVPQDGPLAVKPTGGEGGRGFMLMDFAGGTGDRAAAFEQQVRSALAGTNGSFMVQQKLSPHADLVPLAGSALLGARLITMLDERGEPELCLAVLRFPPMADALVDNIKSGGMMAPIDIETGRLGSGCIGRGVGEAIRHPASGCTIEGREVPHWKAARALALRAHAAAFRDYNLIGWDVAITQDGAYLLEGNGKPCAIVSQRALHKGLGEQRMGQLIAFHLAAARKDTEQRRAGVAEPSLAPAA